MIDRILAGWKDLMAPTKANFRWPSNPSFSEEWVWRPREGLPNGVWVLKAAVREEDAGEEGRSKGKSKGKTSEAREVKGKGKASETEEGSKGKGQLAKGKNGLGPLKYSVWWAVTMCLQSVLKLAV